METGTLDITFTNIYKNDTYKLKKFISHMTITISTAAILGGFCGGVAYNFIDINIYIISSILFFLSLVITLITINIYALNLDAYLRENIDSDTASSMIGISGTITRVFSVLVLLLCFVLVYLMNALNTIIICIVIFVVISIILICRFNFKYK